MSAQLSAEDIAYPRDLFAAILSGNSPYAFYLFQWVPYQTDAKRWRLKMQHDVKAFDGREAFNVWPNGSSCGPFKDHEVEFIRISRSQFGEAWQDMRPERPVLPEPSTAASGLSPEARDSDDQKSAVGKQTPPLIASKLRNRG